jgi:peptidoglycan/LPS O-acetylase OafA/YrhL
MNHTSTAYRPDIDGLRALAVTSVLLFHAFPDAVGGGFVGVDIFFVISGFLITSILVRESQENRFSILRFYVRRARRIFPALLLVLALTLAVGWMMLLPTEWQQLGKHVVSGAAFVSNLTLWREAGYFDGSSELKPLLHLWSLAVEEQYYLVWPLVVHFFARRGARSLAWAATVLALASVLACVVLTPIRPTEAFYLPLTRIWELLIGSGLAIVMTGRSDATPAGPVGARAHAMGVAGVVAMLVAVFGFGRGTTFPGIAALLPTAGAALLIAAGPRSAINRWIFSHPAVVWVGLISYPLYLWHWPLLAFARIWGGEALPTAVCAGLLLLAVVLAWLTCRYAEAPIRGGGRSASATRDAAWLWIGLLSLGAVGALAWTQHFQARSARSQVVQQITVAQAGWESISDGLMRGGQAGTVLFVGDSHMQHYLPRVAQIIGNQTQAARSARVMTLGGCAPVPGLDRRVLDCAGFVERAYAAMQADEVRTIVLAGSWVGFAQRADYFRRGDPSRAAVHPFGDDQAWVLADWARELKALVARGKRVVIVLSSPRGPLVDPLRLIDRSLWSWETTHLEPRSLLDLKRIVLDADAKVRSVATAAGAQVIDPFDAVCSGETCQVVTLDGLPLFIDDSHFRASFVRDEVKFFDEFLLSN